MTEINIGFLYQTKGSLVVYSSDKLSLSATTTKRWRMSKGSIFLLTGIEKERVPISVLEEQVMPSYHNRYSCLMAPLGNFEGNVLELWFFLVNNKSELLLKRVG